MQFTCQRRCKLNLKIKPWMPSRGPGTFRTLSSIIDHEVPARLKLLRKPVQASSPHGRINMPTDSVSQTRCEREVLLSVLRNQLRPSRGGMGLQGCPLLRVRLIR